MTRTLDFTEAHAPHPEAVEHIEAGHYLGKPIVGVDHGETERGPYTLLRVRQGTSTGTVMFDDFEGDEDGLS